MNKYTIDEVSNIFRNLFYNPKLYVKYQILCDYMTLFYPDFTMSEKINILLIENNLIVIEPSDSNNIYSVLRLFEGHSYAKIENLTKTFLLKIIDDYKTNDNILICDEINAINNEIQYINNIELILNKIIIGDEKLNDDKPDHVDEIMNERLYKDKDDIFGFCLNNVMKIDDYVCDYYLELLAKYNIKMCTDRFYADLNDDDLNIFENCTTINKYYRYELFIKIMLYNIKLNVNCYLHYLKFCKKNIIKNNIVEKNMYFNGILKNHITEFNEDEKKNIN